MSEYASRIASLKAEQVRRAQRQSELAAQRREEIGKLAERLGVHETENDVLAGVFLEVKTSITNRSPHIALWRVAGARFRSSKSERHRNSGSATPHPNGAQPGRNA